MVGCMDKCMILIRNKVKIKKYFWKKLPYKYPASFPDNSWILEVNLFGGHYNLGPELVQSNVIKNSKLRWTKLRRTKYHGPWRSVNLIAQPYYSDFNEVVWIESSRPNERDKKGWQDSAKSDSAVGRTPPSQTLRWAGHCWVRLRGGQDSAKSDSAVGRTPPSQTPRWAGHRGVNQPTTKS